MNDDYIKSVHRNIRQLNELSRCNPAEFANALRRVANVVEEKQETGKMYSVDGEYYYLDLDTVMDDLRNHLKPGEETTIFEADAKSFTHNQFINIDYLFDDMKDRAFDEMGEFTDGYLAGVNQEIKTELINLIADYLTNKIGKPAFFEAVNEKEISVKVES